MNIQIKIQTLFLLIVGCSQCMEPEALTLDRRVIRKIEKIYTKKLPIEGEIVELNGFELDCIVLRHRESKIIQELQILSEQYKIYQELKMFINDHI